jgi:hypothetical protein
MPIGRGGGGVVFCALCLYEIGFVDCTSPCGGYYSVSVM